MSVGTRVNLVLWKMIAILIFEKALLTIVLGAPSTNPLLPSNKTDTEINNLPRILTRSNRTRDEEGNAQTIVRYQQKLISTILDVLLGDEDKHDSLFTNSDIIFPDSYELLTKPKPIMRLETIPKCANGLTYCENIETYPYNRVKNMLQQTRETQNEFFGVDEVPTEIGNRIDASEETFICNSVRTTIFPTVGETKNAKWKYIVNQGKDERYVQGILVELCLKSDSTCNLLGDPPVGYTATCKQKYTFRRLLSITDSGQQEPDTFRMPSACCCSFKKDISFLTGVGKNVKPSRRRRR